MEYKAGDKVYLWTAPERSNAYPDKQAKAFFDGSAGKARVGYMQVTLTKREAKAMRKRGLFIRYA